MKHLLLLFFILPFTTHAQKLLKGVVLDEKSTPVPGASVFLSNTSTGTSADAEGKFQLYIPAGKYELIVSSIGFETHGQSITSNELPDFISIKLKIKAPELEAVVIEPYEKNGWQKWGKFFTDYFIGTSSYASDCKIKNPEVLRFRNSKKTNDLTAIALEPLIIENKALGYIIRYQLQTFNFNFKTRYLIYTGYPFFQQMDGSESKQKKWTKNRNDVYYGSMMHFMRSLYRNTLTQEGFEIRPLKKVLNAEKERVKGAYKRNQNVTETSNGMMVVRPINEDSAVYYSHILEQQDYFDVLTNKLLPGDSVAYAVNTTTAGLDFNDYLFITYTKVPAPSEFIRQTGFQGSVMTSQITLINHRPIEIQSNGMYYDPADLLTTGYWAWSEKIATMLPYDFKTEEKSN